MATFNININYPALTYVKKITSVLVEDCATKVAGTYKPALEGVGAVVAMMESYTGDPWKKLVLTSITTNNIAFHIKDDLGVEITNVNLPRTYIVTGLGGAVGITDLNITTDANFTFINALSDYINISFYMEDENGTQGPTLQQSFQVVKAVCSGNPVTAAPLITNTLQYVVVRGNNTTTEWYANSFPPTGVGQGALVGAFSFKPTATNSPTSYSAIGLPAFLSMNTATGWITSSAAHPVVGTYIITVTATNAIGSGNFVFNLKVDPILI